MHPNDNIERRARDLYVENNEDDPAPWGRCASPEIWWNAALRGNPALLERYGLAKRGDFSDVVTNEEGEPEPSRLPNETADEYHARYHAWLNPPGLRRR
jgi:hypothetical protein